jgi:predicted mannosyl-3-phosphoglycerate phosphatase (HAD superfamily)
LPSSRTVVFCAIDDLIPIAGHPLSGFADFLDGLAEARIPSVWVSSRNRHQLDTPIRKLGHAGPFIAENGCGVYLPEDYFHLKPERTVRMGRFTCIPVATLQPVAAQALDSLAGDTAVSVVPLRSLSPREAMQNTGLSRPEAEALRQRDFDELFFFAGASDVDIQKFKQCAAERKLSVRSSGSFYSLAVGASLSKCIQELRKLYDRALHARAFAIALTTSGESLELPKACDRTIVLADRGSAEAEASPVAGRPSAKRLPLFSSDAWPQVLRAIQTRQF